MEIQANKIILHPNSIDPLDLFLDAHTKGTREAERSYGLVEKLLTERPLNSFLLGCKSALMLIVQSQTGLVRNDALFRRKSLQMAQAALRHATADTALEVRLMNGLAWARLPPTKEISRQALSFLRALDDATAQMHLPPLIMLEGLVALSVVFQDRGQGKASSDQFRAACEIDRQAAGDRYEFYYNIRSGGQTVRGSRPIK